MGTGAKNGRLPPSFEQPTDSVGGDGVAAHTATDRRREQPPNPSFEPGNCSAPKRHGASPSAAPGGSRPATSPTPAPPPGSSNGTRPRRQPEGDTHSAMQTATQLDSHEPRPGAPRRVAGRPARMQTAAAKVRHLLRELAAVTQTHPMGDTIPLLLEQTIQTLGSSVATDANVDDGTVGGPGPCKKRGILNMLYIARVRLQTVREDDGVDGFNQHAIRRDLETALGDLKLGQIALREVTKKQWGDQVAQGEHGIQQAIGAVEAVLEDTIKGTWTGSQKAETDVGVPGP